MSVIPAAHHFSGRPSKACYVPAPLPCDVEPRLVDEGVWEPVPNSRLGYGFFMFFCGCFAMWALIEALHQI